MLASLTAAGRVREVEPGVFRRVRSPRLPVRVAGVHDVEPSPAPRRGGRRSPVRQRADQLLAERRVRIVVLDPPVLLSIGDGYDGVRRCGWTGGGWWCDCGRRDYCSHLVAVRTIAQPGHPPAPMPTGGAA